MTKLGAKITMDALDRGALDYVAKPDYGDKTKDALRNELNARSRRHSAKPKISAHAPSVESNVPMT